MTDARPTRTAVVGTTGSGKTSFASRLANLEGSRHVELDALHWQADWTPLQRAALGAEVDEATAAGAWVVDGNYSMVRDIVWERADTIVWLDLSLPRMFWQLWRRSWRRAIRAEELWNGNRERLRTLLASRDSLFVWQLKTYRKHRHRYPGLFAQPEWRHLRIVVLRTPRQADDWLALVEQRQASRPAG